MDRTKYSDKLTDWDLFVLRHQNANNVRLHVVSATLFWFSPVLALFHSPWWLIGFFISGPAGSIGHYLFNDGKVSGKEATSSLQVVKFSTKMVILFLVGKYGQELVLSKRRLSLFKEGKIASTARAKMFERLGVSI